MTAQLVLALVVGGLIAAVIAARTASLERQLRALSRLEGKIDALLKHNGIRFDPYAEMPQPVLDALRRGQKIEAIREYRAATGAGLREAKEYVEEMQRRSEGT